MTFWRKLGIACGQPEEMWPWKTEEEAYYHILEPLGLPISCYDEFVDNYRMYYPPLHQSKFIANGGFWTPSGKVECDSSILRELGYPGMPTYLGCSENEVDDARGGRGVPHRAHHGRRLHALPPLRALPDARHPLPVPRSVLHHQPRAGREARHRRRATGAGSRRAAAASRCAPTWSPSSTRAWCSRRAAGGSPSATARPISTNPFGCLESNVNVLTSVDV